MSSQENFNLKSFPLIKIISSLLLIIGAILAYILSSKPEFMLFQVGGVQLNLILGIFPLLSGIVLLLYSFITYYNVVITPLADKINIKSRKNEITILKDEIQLIRVRDAGKFFIWFVFFFINFYFYYYGIEMALYFSANHNAGLLEFILIPLLMIWFGGLILILFPRKLIIILTKNKAIIQKVNHLPKDNSFETLCDEIFGFKIIEPLRYEKSNQYLYRLILGIIPLVILIITAMLVEIDGIVQPLHALGIFIPIFMLLFSVLMISSALSLGVKQSVETNDKIIRIEELTLTSSINGKNFSWIKSKENIEPNNSFKKGFRVLTKFDILLLFVIFGEALYLAFKFLWLPLYLKYLNGWDIIIGIIMLIVLFFYQFEIVNKLKVDIDSDYSLVREILIVNPNKNELTSQGRNAYTLKNKITTYAKDFKALIKTDFKTQILKIGIAYAAAIVLITLSIMLGGFIFPLYI